MQAAVPLTASMETTRCVRFIFPKRSPRKDKNEMEGNQIEPGSFELDIISRITMSRHPHTHPH